MSPNHKRITAFSLLELSISIIIISIITAGILGSTILVKKFRISSAQNLTISSPINGIKDSAIWLETSLEKSFLESEASDNNPINTWNDIKQSNIKTNPVRVDGTTSVIYSNTINSIPAVKFTNTTDSGGGYLNIADASFLNNTDYTILILEQRASNKANNYLLGDITNTNESTANQNLTLGYNTDGTIRHSQGGTIANTNFYTANVSSYAESANKPRIFTFTQDSTSGKKTYINGILAAENGNTDKLTGITSLRIGNSYNGQIGEIVMFTRALRREERQSIEEYLAKKWNSPVSQTNCTSGIINANGTCTLACLVNVTGVTTPTSVTEGNGNLNCDQTANFNAATIPYTCASGTLNATGTCSCANGYVLNGSVCELVQTCTGGTIDTTSVPGSTIHIFTSSGTLTCPAAKTAQVLVVGGGGSGGVASPCGGGGGGGAGGIVYANAYSITATSYNIVVGAGGSSAASCGGNCGALGNNGSNSVFNDITAFGGGGGGYFHRPGGDVTISGASGGSGGGAGGAFGAGGGSSTQNSQPNSTNFYGNRGGDTTSGNSYTGGGGGGAGGVGQNGGATSQGGAGGSGMQFNITGLTLNYGGGGGGAGGHLQNGGAGGSGVGGSGGTGANDCSTSSGGIAASASSNSGSGGGGATNNTSGAGGSGIVIVRYTN